MRARLALHVSGVKVALREVVLRDKPSAFLDASPSATVPCLVSPQQVIDESLDIMTWALGQNDPEGWLNMPKDGWDWIERCDGSFKNALDRTKYASRYPQADPEVHWIKAMEYLKELNNTLDPWLFGRPTLADFAVLPFVRQFAFIDKDRFDATDLRNAQKWLSSFLDSSRFRAIMQKYPRWYEGDVEPVFP